MSNVTQIFYKQEIKILKNFKRKKEQLLTSYVSCTLLLDRRIVGKLYIHLTHTVPRRVKV